MGSESARASSLRGGFEDEGKAHQMGTAARNEAAEKLGVSPIERLPSSTSTEMDGTPAPSVRKVSDATQDHGTVPCAQARREAAAPASGPDDGAEVSTAPSKEVVAASEVDRADHALAQKPRVMNQACDLCYLSRVRCVKTEGDKCMQCKSRNFAKCEYTIATMRRSQKSGKRRQSETSDGSGRASRPNKIGPAAVHYQAGQVPLPQPLVLSAQPFCMAPQLYLNQHMMPSNVAAIGMQQPVVNGPAAYGSAAYTLHPGQTAHLLLGQSPSAAVGPTTMMPAHCTQVQQQHPPAVQLMHVPAAPAVPGAGYVFNPSEGSHDAAMQLHRCSGDW